MTEQEATLDPVAADDAPLRVWQRVPQGWIEFRSFGDRSPQEWLDWYLVSAEGWLPDAARDAIVDGFRAGVELFADTAFAFAGVSLTLGERPAAFFLCTNVVPAAAETDAAATAFHRLLPLARFGDGGRSESFTTPDGRVGTITLGASTDGGMPHLTAVGEIRLGGGAGTAVVMGLCSDPQQSAELALHVAFALTTTQALPEGVEPAEPEPVGT
ncbi:hypothetical protein ABC195_02705 [Microbacterium sp. 2P01SA-2]|uniref:hypothetical protein n=1 Tax=unclassified Microbacterium TaxID=2609290 RepID=UPI0039A13BD1